jgi:hypothetical protein
VRRCDRPQNCRVGKALSPARERRRKACPPRLVPAGTARGSVANLWVRSRRICPPYRSMLTRALRSTRAAP